LADTTNIQIVIFKYINGHHFISNPVACPSQQQQHDKEMFTIEHV